MPSTPPIKVPILGVDEYTKQFQSMVKRAKKLGQSVEAVGKKLTTMVTLPLLGAGVASMKFARDLNASMANVGTLIPGQTERLKSMKTEVMDLAVQTGVAATTISEGLYETISAFGDAENPINKLTLATKMSKAGMASVKESLALVSAVTKGYGDTSNEAAQRVADMSFLTVKLGQTTFPELAASMGNVVPLATTLKVKQEQLFGAMATLTGVTGGASEVSTQLASALGAIIKPSSAMSKAAKNLGHESAVAMVKELGFAKTIQELGRVTGGSEEKLGKLFTRKEGLNAVLTLLGPQAENFTKKTAAMGKAAGATEEAFKEQTDGINKAGFTWDQMLERLKRFAVQIGDKLLPIVGRLITKLEPFFNRLANMSDETLTMGLKIAGAAAALGPFLMLVGKGIGIVSSLVGAIGSAGGLAGVLAAVTGPVGIAVGAIAGLVAISIYCREEMRSLVDAFAGPVRQVIGEIKDLFQGTGDSASSLGRALKIVVGFMSNLIAPVVKLVTKIGLLPMRWLVRMLGLAGGVVGRLSKGFNLFSKAIQVAWNWIKNLVTGWMEATKAGQFFKSILDGISTAVESVWGWIKNLWDEVSGFLSGVVGWFDKLGVQLDETLSKTLQAQEGGVNQDIVAGMAEAKAAESNVTISFEGLPEGATPKVTKQKGGKLDVSSKGAVMHGAL